MGHRNPQGIAFRPGTDQVYIAEHGPEPDHGDDEINLLEAGGNYGWPCFTGVGNAYNPIAGCQAAGAYKPPLWASGRPDARHLGHRRSRAARSGRTSTGTCGSAR